MRVRNAAPLALAAVVAIGSLAGAEAAPKKKKAPIKKSYDLNLSPFPDAQESVACESTLRTDANTNIHTFKVTGPGKLEVKVTGFKGDWDMGVLSSAGVVLGEGGGTTTPTTFGDTEPVETMVYKSKKAQTLKLRVCNFFGTPQAKVSYVYTYS